MIKMELYHYKCRADSICEICKFIIWAVEKNIDNNSNFRFGSSKIESLGIFEGTIWEFKSNLKHQEIISLLKKAEKEIYDLHIMYETLTYFEIYTGERNRDLNDY
jgi:hypothetical protein